MVKRSAVVSNFDGDVNEFERRYSPAKNARLFRIACMSGEDLEARLSDLECAGLRLGRDIGVVDAAHGPISECEGIVFASDELGVCWWADVAAEKPNEPVGPRRIVGGLIHHIYGPDDEQDEFFDPPCRLVVDNSAQQAARNEPEWTILASRDANGTLDCWTESLGALHSDGCVAITILADEVLGEIPRDWLDDDGELLPQHCDPDGGVRLPLQFVGRQVTGFDGEYLTGPAIPTTDQVVTLTDLSPEGVQAGLKSLGWVADPDQEAYRNLCTFMNGAR